MNQKPLLSLYLTMPMINNINYSVGEDGISISDSYLITNDEDKFQFLQELCLSIEGLELCRTIPSMLTEWKAHNILYQLHLFRKHTKDVDIEYEQTKWTAFMFKLICFLFRERV